MPCEIASAPALRILVMGLPGAGKTTLATALCQHLAARGLPVAHYNADAVRSAAQDWDFSAAGRLRQAHRMRTLSEQHPGALVICDFVAPTEELRQAFAADITIWVATSQGCRFADTAQLFEPPHQADFVVSTQDAAHWAPQLADHCQAALAAH